MLVTARRHQCALEVPRPIPLRGHSIICTCFEQGRLQGRRHAFELLLLMLHGVSCSQLTVKQTLETTAQLYPWRVKVSTQCWRLWSIQASTPLRLLTTRSWRSTASALLHVMTLLHLVCQPFVFGVHLCAAAAAAKGGLQML